jgi:hypothetical protein
MHRRYLKNIVNGNSDSMFLPQTFTVSIGVSRRETTGNFGGKHLVSWPRQRPRAHYALSIQFLAKSKTPANRRPLHSPDFSPKDLPCSRNLGIPEGRQFQSVDEIKENVQWRSYQKIFKITPRYAVKYRNIIWNVLLIKEEIIQKGIMFDKIHVARNTVLFNPSENYLKRPCRRSWGKGPTILNFYARWRFVISFTLRPHLFWKTVARTHWIVGKERTRSKTPVPFGKWNPVAQQCAVTLQTGLSQLGQELILLRCEELHKNMTINTRQSVKLSSVRSWRTC